uniref:neural proliferation differentiation and control protein 1-like n=1 Tax=Semicossyphus pulcher TaxID=241346 RepID=UPI0037E8E5DD
MLLWSPRIGRQRRASLLLLLALVAVCAISVSANLPAHRCSHIDCAREGRHFCRPGSRHCGSCLAAFEENEEGICVARRTHHRNDWEKDKDSFNPNPDEEIDFLQSIIEKQQVVEVKQPKHKPKHPAADSSQADAKKSKADASKQKQRSQSRHSDHTVNTTAAAPPPAVSALDAPTTQPGATVADGRAHPIVVVTPKSNNVIIILISLFVAVGLVAFVMATVCYVKLQKESRLAQKVDYPAFKGTDPPAATANGTSMGDKTLAQSAQMYHYQHQKQQMLSVGNHKPEQKVADTEVTSDEEEVGGDFTVYECPGLAPTGEMEVKNPLFDDSNLQYQGNQK